MTFDIRRYLHPDTFVAEVAMPMARDAIANNVFLIIADQMANTPETGHLRYGVFDGRDCILAAWMTPPYRLGLADLGSGPAAAAALADFLAREREPIPGVVGPKRLAHAFADHWRAKIDPGLSRDQNFYRVESVRMPTGVSGAMRLASGTERELLYDWMAAFAEDANLPPAEHGRDFAKPRVDRALADGCAHIWEDCGRPVACAIERPFRQEGARVSTVFTDRGQRGKGYGGAITAALSRKILDGGRWCVLFADAQNPLTNGLYQRLGYQFQAVYSDIHFDHA